MLFILFYPIPLATLASFLAEHLPEQAPQRSLPAPVWTWSISQAEAQVWQGGPPSAAPAYPAGAPPEASPDALAGPTLLVYDYLSRQLAAEPWAQGIYQADAARPNCRPPLPASKPAGACLPAGELLVSSPAWHVQLLRLLFQLVLAPELAACLPPSLAAHTQLTVAAVRQVLASLAEQGFWQKDAPPGTSPLRLPAPAHYWLAHYAGTLRRRLNAQRYRPRHPATLASWARHGLPSGCQWSGEAAAHLLLGHPEPPTSLTIYSHLPRPQLVQQLGLVPAPRGSIELLNAFAPAACCAPTDPRCVPPLLVYADLLATQKPADEALAHELRARYLAELLA